MIWQRASGCHNGSCVEVSWVHAAASPDGAQCVEAGRCPHGDWLVRDSKDPAGPVLKFTEAEWDAFLKGARAGEFDDLAGLP